MVGTARCAVRSAQRCIVSTPVTYLLTTEQQRDDPTNNSQRRSPHSVTPAVRTCISQSSSAGLWASGTGADTALQTGRPHSARPHIPQKAGRLGIRVGSPCGTLTAPHELCRWHCTYSCMTQPFPPANSGSPVSLRKDSDSCSTRHWMFARTRASAPLFMGEGSRASNLICFRRPWQHPFVRGIWRGLTDMISAQIFGVGATCGKVLASILHQPCWPSSPTVFYTIPGQIIS